MHQFNLFLIMTCCPYFEILLLTVGILLLFVHENRYYFNKTLYVDVPKEQPNDKR